MATAYLAFASKNIGLYRVMFTDNHLAIRFDDGLARSATAAFQELQDVVGARLPAACGKGEAKRVATAIWAGLHGAALLVSGRLIPVGGPRDKGRAEAEGTAIAQLLIERFSEPKRPSRRRVTGRSRRGSPPFRVALFPASGVGRAILLAGSSLGGKGCRVSSGGRLPPAPPRAAFRGWS